MYSATMHLITMLTPTTGGCLWQGGWEYCLRSGGSLFSPH